MVGGSQENSTASARSVLCDQKFVRKNTPSFPQKYGFENAKKSQTIFSDFRIWSVHRVSLRKNSHQATAFFSLTAASVELAILLACDTSLPAKCALSKAAEPSKEFWLYALGRMPFTKTSVKKYEKSHGEVLHLAWNKLVFEVGLISRHLGGVTSSWASKVQTTVV